MAMRVHPQDVLEAKAEIFKALGHPARLQIVEKLSEGPCCVCDLVALVGGAQPTTSRHLDILVRSGVLRRRREGIRMMYELAIPCVLKALPCITEALHARARRDAELVRA